MTSLGQVTFTCDAVDAVTVWLDEAPVVVTGGYGGWTVVNRQRRKGITIWDGVDPLRMQVSILFDGLLAGASQELAISRLNRMALPPGEWEEPPLVQISGDGIPPTGVNDWVVESHKPGTNKVIWDFARNGVLSRLRQDYVVNLLQFIDEDRVAFSDLPPAGGIVVGGASAGGWPRQYITKLGDTLMKVAALFYHDASKWEKIAKANNLRDPKNVPKNTLLTIPKP